MLVELAKPTLFLTYTLSPTPTPPVTCNAPELLLPDAVLLVIATSPDAFIVLAETTNLPIVLPSNIVFDVGTRAVTLATNPLVVKLAALILLATDTLLLVLLNVNPDVALELPESLNCICVLEPLTPPPPATVTQYGEPVDPLDANTWPAVPTPPLADNNTPAAIVTWVVLAIKLDPIVILAALTVPE